MFGGYGRKLESGCIAARNRSGLRIDDGILKPADAGHDRNRSIP